MHLTDEQIVEAVGLAMELADAKGVHYAVDDVAEFYEDLHTAVHGEQE